MNILYVKNSNLRDKKYQLRTIIFEENGSKFVKKEVISEDAIPHLMSMKSNYTKLENSIVNPNVKIAKIVSETKDSLTFEYIEGVSLEERFFLSLQKNQDEAKNIIDEFKMFLSESFKTKKKSSSEINENLKKSFNFNQSFYKDTEKCFETISNIDLIFSNVIYKNNEIYIIDYEWSYDLNLPLDYILYRAFDSIKYNFALEYPDEVNYLFNEYFDENSSLFYKSLEEKFQSNVSGNNKNSLERFKKSIVSPTELLESRNEDIILLNNHIVELNAVIQSLRLKNRVKRIGRKIIGDKIYKILKYMKNNPSILKKTFRVIKKDGFSGLASKLNRLGNENSYSFIEPKFTKDVKNELNNFSKKPLLSIIMPVYNVDSKWLDFAIKSIESQWYENWELCICDDKSTKKSTIDYLKSIANKKIKIKFLEKNMNISAASNEAIGISNGEYIVLMDNDDEVTPDALYEIVKVINEKNADFIYSDEDFISINGVYINPHFKPDFSPDLLLSHNYITHLSCIKRELLDEVGYFNSKYDGAQDYELFLRVSEKAQNIYHIPKVLYHWRMLETSTSMNSEVKPEALNRGKYALEDTLKRREVKAEVLNANLPHYFRVKYKLVSSPLVSIIMPFKDKPDLLKMCVESILNKSTYKNFEIIGISNNSTEKETFKEMKRLEKLDNRIKFYEYNEPFNYSKINNFAVKNYANGEHIILLNNDIEIISPNWIESMLEHSQREDIGCVGAKLYYSNDKVQHAGIIIGLGGYAAHSHRLHDKNEYGYFNRLNIVQNMSAVTGACLMVKKSIYEKVNGMNEKDYAVAYNDVDFCLRVSEKKYKNIFTPFAKAYHYESISRGLDDDSPEKIQRFEKEKKSLYERHKNILDNGDPYYNVNLTLSAEDFSLK